MRSVLTQIYACHAGALCHTVTCCHAQGNTRQLAAPSFSEFVLRAVLSLSNSSVKDAAQGLSCFLRLMCRIHTYWPRSVSVWTLTRPPWGRDRAGNRLKRVRFERFRVMHTAGLIVFAAWGTNGAAEEAGVSCVISSTTYYGVVKVIYHRGRTQ